MSWKDDISEITQKVMSEYCVPEVYEEAVRKAALLGLQANTRNWLEHRK